MVHRFATDAEAWAELDQLLDRALDLPAPLRAGWIEALAPRFEELKPRLRGLLLRGPGVETDDFLNRLPQFDLDAGNWAPPGHGSISPGTRSDPIDSSASWAAEAWAPCGWPSAPTGSSIARSR